jgi:hypothetical protein
MARHQVLAIAFGIAIVCVSAIPAIITWRASANLLAGYHYMLTFDRAFPAIGAWFVLIVGLAVCANLVLRAFWPK